MKRYEHFAHEADIGVRGLGASCAEAFEQAALALTAIVTDPAGVAPMEKVELSCEAPDAELLLTDWLNALIYEMAVRHMLFGRYEVAISGNTLRGAAWGEAVDAARHLPVVEPKGATYTGLSVRNENGAWVAECVVDV
ncbi:MAG TPA: archease [Gallionellaceae bacterium]